VLEVVNCFRLWIFLGQTFTETRVLELWIGLETCGLRLGLETRGLGLGIYDFRISGLELKTLTRTTRTWLGLWLATMGLEISGGRRLAVLYMNEMPVGHDIRILPSWVVYCTSMKRQSSLLNYRVIKRSCCVQPWRELSLTTPSLPWTSHMPNSHSFPWAGPMMILTILCGGVRANRVTEKSYDCSVVYVWIFASSFSPEI